MKNTTRPRITTTVLEAMQVTILLENPLDLSAGELDTLLAERSDYPDLIELQDQFVAVSFEVDIFRTQQGSLDRSTMLQWIEAKAADALVVAQPAYEEYVDRVQEWRDLHAVIEANQELANPKD